MKAAILQDFNQVIVGGVDLPERLKCGQVLVRVLAATICGAQIGEITGAKGDDPYLPHLLGHEGCGRVEGIGDGVTKVKPGDYVVMHWRKGSGIDAPPPKYAFGDGQVGGGPVTTFSEYSVVSENRLTPISSTVPLGVASLMGCAVTTAFGLVNNEAHLKIGQSIAVLGVGGVGLNVIQAAKLVSAHPIIALDKIPGKLKLAEQMGATAFLTNVNQMARNVDVFVDCTGIPELIDLAFRRVAPGGKLILVGQPEYSLAVQFEGFRQHYRGKTILDSQGGLTDPDVDIPRYLQLYSDGLLPGLDSLITHVFPLDEINTAIDVARSGIAGRVMLEMLK